MQQLQDTRIYVMHRAGPTSFVLYEDQSDQQRKVCIGNRPTCTCGGGPRVGGAAAAAGGASGGAKELCIHVLFVMVKVLRVPPSNPLVWQLCLTDRELDEVLRCSAIPEPTAAENSQARGGRGAVQGAGGGSKTEAGAVKRRALDDEEPCPVCYEDMTGVDLDALVWCKRGCGRNIHGKCMSKWADHQVHALSKELTCPLCRGDWGPFLWRPPPPKRAKAEAKASRDAMVHYGTKCSGCRKVGDVARGLLKG